MNPTSGHEPDAIPQHALLAAIVESSFDAIISKSLDGIVTSWNPAAERIFGYAGAEILGRSITLLIPPELLAQEEAILLRLRHGGRVDNLETTRLRKDGSRIDVSITSSPVRDSAGEIVGASKIVRDISRAKADARALEASEARFRSIFDNAFQFIGLLSPDGIVLEVNRAALTLGCCAQVDVVGKPIWNTCWFDHSPAVADLLRRAVEDARGGSFARFEVIARSMAGDETTLDFSLRPVRDSAGRVIMIVPEGRDISARKRDEQALKEGSERLTAIVDSAMDAIITVDDHGRILVFNDAAAAMFRCDAGDARGMSLTRFLPERHRAGHARLMTAFGQGRATSRAMGRPGQISALRADGSEFPAEASISHVEVDGRQMFTVIMRDLTELRQAQADRSALENQLRGAQKMEAIGTLAGGIAHDFNNIMGAIVGNVGLAKGDLPEGHAARVSLDQIDRAATRARSVVRQILAFSRKQPQELVPQALAPIVSEALELLRATLPSVVQLDERLPDGEIFIRADATQIHQVLLNLCTNAWHALRGSTGRIEVGLQAVQFDSQQAVLRGTLSAGPHAHVWVADNGCGMDAAILERIFEPFFTTKPRGEGTGLGLSVVHGIVVAHGGAISAESTPGFGTVVNLHFPTVENGAASAAPDRPAPSGDVGRGRRVLYVDDDDVMLLMVERLLTRSGFVPTCHRDAEAALAAFQKAPSGWDVVVSDFNMPKLSGLELAARVTAIAPGMPVIVSSGYIPAEMRASARQAGVRALLEKENTFEQLCGLVLQVLGGEAPVLH